MDTAAGYPNSTEAQIAWLKSRWPWIDVDIEGVHPEAFAHCLPALEKLASFWPEPFTALKAIKASPDSSGWPDSPVLAWYDGKGDMTQRCARA